MPRQVLESIQNSAGDLCVDIFVRDDGTFGYEEYRRDPEEGGKWFPLRRHAGRVFTDRDQAVAHAKGTVRWLLELQ